MKLVKAVALVILGVVMVSMDHQPQVQETLHAIKPDAGLVTKLFAKILETSPRHLSAIGFGSIIYAIVFAIEGVGLLRRKRWAEYMTVIITTSFIPIEVYEMVEKGSLLKAGVIVLNIAIVIYLIVRLRRESAERREHEHDEEMIRADRVEIDREKIEATLRSPRTPSASGAARV